MGAAPASASAPPVEFLDHTPLTFEVDALRTGGSGIPFELRNATGEPVQVRVRVVGLERGQDDPALAALFATAGVPAEVPANGEESGRIGVIGADNPKPGSYAGSLVVVPAAGAVDRRPLTLTVEAAEPRSASGAVLDPADLPDATLPATNFLPSLLAPVAPPLIVVGVILITLLAIWRHLSVPVQIGGVVLALAALVAGYAFEVFGHDDKGVRDLADQPGARAIVAESVPVSDNVEDGRAGVVLDGEGDIAELVVERGRLRPRALEHAGAHTGQVDLNGSDEGSATATVNVRDWWPWAVAAIALGVFVGYRVRLWFDRDRGRARLALRADELWARVQGAVGAPGARPTWIPVEGVRTRLEAIRQRLKEDDTTDAAETELDELEAFVKGSEALRARVDELAAAREQYEAAHAEHPFGVAQDEIVAMSYADKVLARGLDTSAEADYKKLLDDARADVDAATEFVETGADRFRRIARFATAVKNRADNEPDKEKADKLRAKQDELEDLARLALRAADLEAVEKAYSDATDALKDLPPDIVSDISAQADVGPAFVTGAPTAPARIELRIVAPGVDPAERGNVDDLFAFRLVVPEPPAAGLTVSWSFGEGDPVTQPIAPSGEGAWIERRYSQPGDYKVRVEGEQGEELAAREQRVGGPSRLVTARETLQQRERRFRDVAIALTIASGMSTLYFVDPAWGTNEDYVKALLWGAVVSEGVALVGAVIANLFPRGK